MSLNNNCAIIVGARPNFIKLAPFIKKAKNYPEFKFKIIHTGQHFDKNMSDIFFNEMEIPKPDIQLDINGKYYTEKMGKMFNALKKVFNENNFDSVIVFGDVNSTLAGAIAAVKNNCKIIHIESGLRSYDRRMPEEINRKIVDDLNIKEKKYIVTTVHKLKNTDDPKNLKKILKIINNISKNYKIIFPIHPGTRKKIYNYNLENYLKNITVIEPLGYFDFMKLVISSKGVIGDSCGIQDETSHLGVSCCTLNNNTERPITIELGSNKLFNINNLIIDDLIHHLNNDFKKKN